MKIKRLFYVYLWILTSISISIFGCGKEYDKFGNAQCSECDQIDLFINYSKSDSINKASKLQYLDKARDLVQGLQNDSLRSNYFFHLSNRMYVLEEYGLFKEFSSQYLRIAEEYKDTLRIADYYWNMGLYQSKIEVSDSAYYNFKIAGQLFRDIDHKYYQAKMDYNIAYLLRRSKNYIESEAYAYKSISKLQQMDRQILLYRCFNHLGLLYYDLGQYEYSIIYHTKALEKIVEIPRKNIFFERSLNNLSLVYQKQEKYELAIKTLDQALENDELKKNHSNLYAKLIDNRAYCMFLNEQDKDVYPIYMEALQIRKQAGDRAAEVISRKHLAYYFLKKGDSLKAYEEVKIAYDISSKLGLNRDILENLNLLSDADPKNSSTYMNRYISLNDSLLYEERKIRDKFTRIQFETENYIAANEDLKRKNVWISLTSGFGIFSLGLFFFLYRQRSRNRALNLERQHHQDNEEIYDLMLKQQNKTEEGRIQERIRISQELHDGILARLFSVRMGLGFLNVGENIDDITKYDAFMKELQLVEKEIRTLSHELKADDLSSKKDFTILLSELLKEQSTYGQFNYELDADRNIAWNRVDEAIKINLYRISQEAVYNIIKYAKAQKVIVRLKKKKEKIELSIVDDGLGFDTNKKQKGIGLKNMHSRAKTIGAEITIQSELETGTEITLSILTKTIYHEAKEQSTDH